MHEQIRRILRTTQTFLPALADVKPAIIGPLRNALRRSFEVEFEVLRAIGRSRGLYLDVGANRGQSIEAIRLNAFDPQIISFEPNPMLADRLARTFGQLPTVRVEPVGLGDRNGEFDLYVPSYRGYAFDGLASFNKDEAMSWLSPHTILRFDSAKLGCTRVRCQVRTLDSFGLDPFFIKLDVQGNEFEALLGGTETLRRHRPVLLIETSSLEAPGQKVTGFVREFGYLPFWYDGRKRNFVPGLGGQNTFFVPDTKNGLVSRFVQ